MYCSTIWYVMGNYFFVYSRILYLLTHFLKIHKSTFQVLWSNSHIVAYEVVLSIHRLVKKYGKDLQFVTWNIIMDILESLLKSMEVCIGGG